MARAKHAAASLLLAAGMILVFAGLTSALGFTPTGVLGSAAAIAGLVYAGGTWFGAPQPASLAGDALLFDHRLALLFDHRLALLGGGAPLLAEFPAAVRDEIRRRCLDALDGAAARFTIVDRYFEAVPVSGADGVVIYGVLVVEGAPQACQSGSLATRPSPSAST